MGKTAQPSSTKFANNALPWLEKLSSVGKIVFEKTSKINKCNNGFVTIFTEKKCVTIAFYKGRRCLTYSIFPANKKYPAEARYFLFLV